jgi:pyridoxal 5'-phosphate synthase pdxT subunit
VNVGVLALQGDVTEHMKVVVSLGVTATEVRVPAHLERVDGLIIPGGESTTIGKLMVRYGLDRAIPARVHEGLRIYGTCAGMILMARSVRGGEPPLLRLMDITVLRNAYGRQVDSFEADLEIPVLGPPSVRAVFIRAPIIEETGSSVDVLASLDGRPVLVRQGGLLASSFHPELSPDARVHRYFLDMIRSGTETLRRSGVVSGRDQAAS